MSSPKSIPSTQARNSAAVSPVARSPQSPKGRFLIPSPVPTRRTRTYSACEKAAAGPEHKGTVKSFCRQRGHGFIHPHPSEGDIGDLFVHISDIDGEFVPKEGDEVTYKKILIPPKNEKYQAVHVTIVDLAPGVTHERWEDAPSPK